MGSGPGVEIGWDVGDIGGVVGEWVVLKERGGCWDRVGEDVCGLAEGREGGARQRRKEAMLTGTRPI